MELKKLAKRLKELGYSDLVKYDSEGKVSNYDLGMVLNAIDMEEKN